MTTRAEIFEKWMLLKFNIQGLAVIMQNDTPVRYSETEINDWLNEFDAFLQECNKLKLETLSKI